MHNIAQVLNIIANKSNKTDYEIFLFKSCSLCIDYDFIIPEINKEPRDYQLRIFETCKNENCLVVLPTGTGKTLIDK